MATVSRRLPLAAALAALASVAPQAVRAQESVAWTLCTPGALSACSSVQLSTTPHAGGGTDVTIAMHNLNGQDPHDNTLWSGLYSVEFLSQSASFSVTSGSGALSLGGGATGGATWSYGAANNHLGWNDLYIGRSGANSLVGGCAAGTYNGSISTAAYTCLSTATASLSFTTSNGFNATGVGGVAVGLFAGSQATPQGDLICGENFDAGGRYPACNVLNQSFSVTPEPVSMALMATGLFGIGGVRLRRRKRTLG